MVISLKEQLKDQLKVEAKLQPVNAEISEYINQTEIFNIITSSMKYGFEIKDEVTNAYVIDLKLSKSLDNTYTLFIGRDVGQIVSDVKPIHLGFITLDKSKDKLSYETSLINKDKITIDEIKNIIKFIVGI